MVIIEFVCNLTRHLDNPEGEGANIDRRLVPYHAKCMRIQSRIEFIYIYIYLFIYIFIYFIYFFIYLFTYIYL